MPYAFRFDASACSGCKACQAACKDKNNLPVGVLWRRTYEAGGGEWTRSGEAWTSTVYAYNLSIACNHCVHPKCAGVCPVDAFHVRGDGIVLLDSSKCVGCGYCSWACPYGAPQFDSTRGVMSKCNFCFDEIDSGRPPACVAACPLRCLEMEEQAKLDARGVPFRVVYPMPVTSRTEPRLYIKPHPAAALGKDPPQLLNREEVSPRRSRHAAWAAREEIPLLVFTLLGQAAAGISWVLAALALTGQRFPLPLFLAVGFSLVIGLLVAFFHLGKPASAWRVFNNLKKSWLSRELLAALGFLLAWGAAVLSYWLIPSNWILQTLLAGLTAAAGILFINSMAEVYRLRMVPAWNTWRTKAAFYLSALLLGLTAVELGLASNAIRAVAGIPSLIWLNLGVLVVLALELFLSFTSAPGPFRKVRQVRLGLTVLAFLVVAFVVLAPIGNLLWINLAVFLLVLWEETLGRWIFYAQRNPLM